MMFNLIKRTFSQVIDLVVLTFVSTSLIAYLQSLWGTGEYGMMGLIVGFAPVFGIGFAFLGWYNIIVYILTIKFNLLLFILIPIIVMLCISLIKSSRVQMVALLIMDTILCLGWWDGELSGISFAYRVIFIICVISSVMEVLFQGKCLGKLLIRIKVVSVDNRKTGFSAYFYRNHLKYVGILLWPLSLMYFLVKKELPWDSICKTKVI